MYFTKNSNFNIKLYVLPSFICIRFFSYCEIPPPPTHFKLGNIYIYSDWNVKNTRIEKIDRRN